MAVVNKSSSDLGTGFDSHEPLNGTVKSNWDRGFGVEGWQLTKGSTWAYQAPYRVVSRPSHTSVVVIDMDPYDAER